MHKNPNMITKSAYFTMSQVGFFDFSDCYASLDAKQDPLVEIEAIVQREDFRPVLERASS